MRIEIATTADIPALCELLAVLFSQEVEFEPDVRVQSEGLRQIIENPAVGMVLLARSQDRVVGMVNLLFTVSTALGGRVGLLEDMVVVPGVRSGGTGTRLLAEAVALARRQGCLRITLLTDGDNQAAQRFYARQGFVPSSMLPMRLLLA